MMVDPTNFPSPISFLPERWFERDIDKKSFLPFSAGSRNCPGQQFSLKELRLVLVCLLRNFEVRLIEGQNHEQRVHTVPWFVQGGYRIAVKPRA